MDERLVCRGEVSLITVLFGEFDKVGVALLWLGLVFLIESLVLFRDLRGSRDLHAHFDLLGLLALYLHLHDLSRIDHGVLHGNLGNRRLLELVGEVNLVLVYSLLGDDLLLVQVVDKRLLD